MDVQKEDRAGSTNARQGEFQLRVVSSFKDIDEARWNSLAGASGKQAGSVAYNPFVTHAYLSSLEEAGCASSETGWLGQHLLLEAADNSLRGALPCYVKNHSQGEYVFDHGWADAYERAGGHYYPKLQASIPFTPATGPRLLTHTDFAPEPVRAALASGLKTLTDRHGLSSAHVTFIPDEEVSAFDEQAFLRRSDQQFHFHNTGYKSYGEFLETLASRKRKTLKRERRVALENNVEIDWLSGKDLTESIWDVFYEFYMDTGSRKWGRPYLTRQFFSLIGERMADDILLIMARRGSRYIAGAINFIGADTLFGRHWGCVEDHPFLHFEVCYHQAIDFALAKGLPKVEAGAQGQHKLSRGYLPVTTHSAHYITHPGLRNAVADYLEHEREDVSRMADILHEHGPFKKG